MDTSTSHVVEHETFHVTADMVVFSDLDSQAPHVLLVQRGKEPFKDQWVLPGGHVDADESALDAAVRELVEETSLIVDPAMVHQVATFSDPQRDPRGRRISVAYTCLVTGLPPVAGGDDAAEAKWITLKEAANLTLGFDHSTILEKALLVASSIFVL